MGASVVDIVGIRSIGRIEAIKVEELGVGEEVQVAFAEADFVRELVSRRDVVEVGDVLRHIRCATPVVGGRHRYLSVQGIEEGIGDGVR